MTVSYTHLDVYKRQHGDCLEDAEYLAGLVREKMGIQDILINNIGTVIGSHTLSLIHI